MENPENSGKPTRVGVNGKGALVTSSTKQVKEYLAITYGLALYLFLKCLYSLFKLLIYH